MNRREVIQRLTLMLGGAVSAPIIAGAMGEKTNFGPSVEVTPEQERLLAEIADVIIPATGTPGAKEAGVQKFIIRVVSDCYLLADQEKFFSGLENLRKDAVSTYGKAFEQLSSVQKTEIVKRSAESDRSFFLTMKSLTVTGYFTSEIGATQALEYLPVPGKFIGSYPLTREQKTWAL